MPKVETKTPKAAVSIVMGSQSDMRVMQDAVEILTELKITFKIDIVSAHRTPDEMYKYAKEAHKKHKVIIAGAGGAAHLPGMIASLTDLPVIGVPVMTGKIKGLDSLLSIAQMPKGIPVATVAVDNAYNAGLLAARILGVNNTSIYKKLSQYRTDLKKKIQKQRTQLKDSLS